MIAQEIITDYEKLCHSVTDLIAASGYKIEYVYTKMGLTRLGFYKKRKTATFKPAELQKLFTIIDNGSLEDKLLGKIMNKARGTGTLSEKETRNLFKNK